MPFDVAEFDRSGGARFWETVTQPHDVAQVSYLKTSMHWAFTKQYVALTDTQTIRELNALRQRPANWDGCGAVRPDGDTIEAVKALYWKLPAGQDPAVCCAGDGEISLVWDNQSDYLELGVDADGTVSFYGRGGSGLPLLGDLDEVPDSLPESLLSFLSRFSHGRVRVRA